MKRRHFERFRPVCPVCQRRGVDVPLELRTVVREAGEASGAKENSTILEGVLTCADPACMAEYPIIDGIPIIVADLRGFVSRNAPALLARSDLSEILESLVGDCCGPQSEFDVRRQHLGSYAFDHYGDLDPEEGKDGPAPPGSILRLLREGLSRVGEVPAGSVLDAGCAVGRTSFALAEATDDLVLGVDLNLDMLRTASQVLHEGIVRYPRRRIGMVYDRREFPVSFSGADRVDFWACDAGAIPLASLAFGTAVSLNLLDCMNSPMDHLREIARILSPGGRAALATPYDWSPNATPVEGWIGGHSQRSDFRGAAEPLLRHLLSREEFRGADGLEIVSEASVPWSVRVHDRAAMAYQSHLMILRKGLS
jgi:SAM-dependent methyltransferase/uncharacterized protein YbaR (Trm112 family)